MLSLVCVYWSIASSEASCNSIGYVKQSVTMHQGNMIWRLKQQMHRNIQEHRHPIHPRVSTTLVAILREALYKRYITENFTFMWPCTVTNFVLIKTNRRTNFPNLFWLKMNLYMFRAVPLPIFRSSLTVHLALAYVIQVWSQLTSRAGMESRPCS